jgi:hypothetical protein
MTTQSNLGFLQTTTAQMTLVAVVAIVVIAIAWRYVY